MHRLLTGTPVWKLARAVSIGCIVALAVLAWTPAQAMTRTNLGHHAEHFLAYLGTALVMGLASRTTPRLGAHGLLLICYAAFLEAGQLYAPGRQASWHDFAFSAGGVLFGCALVWLARRCSLLPGDSETQTDAD